MRFHEPRPIEYPGEWKGEMYTCHYCYKCYNSKTAAAHHLIQKHCINVGCFACEKIFTCFRHLVEHALKHHKNEIFQCCFCKSTFGKVKKLKLYDWRKIRHHMYGELVYAKLSEYQEKENERKNVVNIKMGTKMTEHEPKHEIVEYCIEHLKTE